MNPMIQEYLDYLKADYVKWAKESRINTEELEKDFVLSVVTGSKFLKVVVGTEERSNRRVHSFICRTDMGKFLKGDILKPADWAAPAKNFARGNVIAKNFKGITWAGA
jgi:hypothetical protein